LEEFGKEELFKGFSDEMKSAALKKFKINKVRILLTMTKNDVALPIFGAVTTSIQRRLNVFHRLRSLF